MDWYSTRLMYQLPITLHQTARTVVENKDSFIFLKDLGVE